jgi:TPR repeat protein/Zn-dependent protease with chaperone function
MVIKAMTSGEPVQQLTPRLNPFAFPSDTDFRFWLLIFTVFGSSLFIYTHILTDWVLPEHLLGVSRGLRMDCHILIANEMATCIQHNREILLPWIVGTTFFLLGVTCVIHWSSPYRMLRRSSLVPFHSPDVESVAAYVKNLCLEVGLSRIPNFVWNPLNPAKTGQAFGCFGRYYIALSGGLVTQFYTDRPTFRAVVLHELAHLKNEDIDKTYFTVAIWQAFVIAALVPFAVSRFRAPILETVDLSWRVLALTAFAYLTRTSILRTREFYADVRASVWEGQSGALKSVLAGMPQPRTDIWQLLFQVHPQSLERKRILEDTYPLFRMKFWDAVGAGIAAGIVSPYIGDLLYYTTEFTVFWLGSAVLIPLAACAVGVQIWRGTFAEMMRAGALPHTWGAGLGLASGLFLGPTLSLRLTTNMSNQASVILWDAVLLVSVASFMPWIAAGASSWLEVAVTLRSPRTIYRSGLIVSGLLLGIWYATVSSSALLSARVFRMGIASVLILPITDPLFLVISTGLWAFPLSAWFWRGRLSSFESEWAFLDRPAYKRTFARQVPLSLGVALKIGVLGGLIASLVAIIALTAQRVGPLVTRIRHSNAFAYSVEWTVLVVLIEAAVSELVRSRVGRLPVVHGLFAASIAGWLVVLTTLAVRLCFNDTVTAANVLSTCGEIVNGGTMASLLVLFGWQSFNRVYHWLSEVTFQRVLGNLLRASESHSVSRYCGINLGWLERHVRFAIANLQNRELGRRLVLGLALMVMTFLGVLLERSYKEVALSSMLMEGSQHLDMGDYDWAISVYRKVLLVQPDNADAHNGLGKALAQKGQFGEATTEFRKELVLKSNTADAHFNLGFALGMQGKVEEAIAEFREAIRLNPEYAEAHTNLGVGLFKQGKRDEAIVEFREAIRLEPTYAEPHYHLGNVLHVRDEDEKAILEFREAIRLKPKFAEAHNNLGITLQTRSKFKEATAEFREAVRLNPTDGRNRYNLVDNLHRQGNYDEAIAELQKVFAFQPSDSAGINDDLGHFLALPGRFDEVMSYISKSLSTSKRGEAYTLASLGFVLDVYALSWFRKAAEAGEAHGMSGLGFMYENGRGGLSRDDVQAVSWYRKATDAGNARAMANLGRMYAFGLGGLPRDDVQAVSWFRKAADAGGARGMSGLGFMYAFGRGGLPRDDVQAVSWFRKAADAGDAHGMCGLGSMYGSGRGGLHKDNEEAVKWYRKAVNAGDVLAMADLGFLYEKGGGGLPKDTEEAVKWYRKAADAGNATAMANLGGLYFEGLGGLPTDDEQAVSWFRKAADAGDAWGMYKLGTMYERARWVAER